jgi:predicted nucleic acid-binding protein
MRYWDASALVPLVVAESSSKHLRGLARDRDIVTWCLSAVEISSAIERRAREGALPAEGRRSGEEVQLFAQPLGAAQVVEPLGFVERLAQLAETLLVRPPTAATCSRATASPLARR